MDAKDAEIERLRADAERLTRESADWQTIAEAHNEVMEAKLSAAEAERDRLREALIEALPYIEQGEYLLESCAYSYGCDPVEPSPAEWGVSAGYQQTRDAAPRDQFRADVARYHADNLADCTNEEGNVEPEFLSVANKVRAALSPSTGEGS